MLVHQRVYYELVKIQLSPVGDITSFFSKLSPLGGGCRKHPQYHHLFKATFFGGKKPCQNVRDICWDPPLNVKLVGELHSGVVFVGRVFKM